METFLKIVRERKNLLVKNLTVEESKNILQSLVSISLDYKIKGDMAMYNHSINYKN